MLDRVWHISYLPTAVRFVFSYKDHHCREHSEEIWISPRAKDMIMELRCTITMLYNSTMLLLLIPECSSFIITAIPLSSHSHISKLLTLPFWLPLHRYYLLLELFPSSLNAPASSELLPANAATGTSTPLVVTPPTALPVTR